MDPGPPPHGVADERRIGQGRLVAQFGVVQRREVVHRDDRPGPSGGRHHEVGAVHDIDVTDEPLQRRNAHSPPQGLEGAGRHGPLGREDVGRQVGDDLAAATPTDGEGADFQIVAGAQRLQRALAKSADTGGLAQKRRGIERHPEPRRHRLDLVHESDRLGTRRALHTLQVVMAPSMDRMAPVTYAASPDPR